jgi:ArsR family transcriptional regulator
MSIDTILVDMNAALDLVACCRPLDAPAIDEAEAEATAGLFKALADPSRVKILNLLATSPEAVCACEFNSALGLTQATVSHHLKKLTDAGLLQREQRGKWAYFSINTQVLARVANLIRLPEVAR